MFNLLQLSDWTCEETVFFPFAAAVSLYKYQYLFGCEKEKVVYFYISSVRMHEGYSKEKANHKMRIASRSLNSFLKKLQQIQKIWEWSEVNSCFSLWISSIFLGFWNANKICNNNVVFFQEYFLVVLILLKNFSSKFQDFKIFSIK